MGLNCAIGWPSTERIVEFRGREVRMMPETDTLAPSLVIQTGEGLTRTAAQRLLQEFMSGLAWAEGGRIVETFSTFSSPVPIRVGKGSGGLISNGQLEYLPDPDDPQARLALALYREAVSINATPYAFLGFAKIISVLHGKGTAQIEWINRTLPLLTDKQVASRMLEIRAEQPDPGEYLYVSGRCAVAHAHAEPVVNPDEPENVLRLASDLPVMRALAEHAIEHEFGVRSKSTFWDEHLHELEGFRQAFGPEVVASLKAKGTVSITDLSIPDHLTVRHHPGEQVPSFEGMDAVVESVTEGVVAIRLATTDGLLTCWVHLHFPEERLTFGAMNHLIVKDNGTDAFIRRRIDSLLYFRGWMRNGTNEVWDAKARKRLGCSAPVMPVNMRADHDAMDAEIRGLEERLSNTGSSSPP